MVDSHNDQFWANLDELLRTSEIVIDRPQGSQHPRLPHIVYPVSYGFLRGTTGGDGAGVDIWIGESGEAAMASDSGTEALEVQAVIATVDLWKRDAEVKLVVGCAAAEVEAIMGLLNERDSFQGIVIWREGKGDRHAPCC